MAPPDGGWRKAKRKEPDASQRVDNFPDRVAYRSAQAGTAAGKVLDPDDYRDEVLSEIDPRSLAQARDALIVQTDRCHRLRSEKDEALAEATRLESELEQTRAQWKHAMDAHAEASTAVRDLQREVSHLREELATGRARRDADAAELDKARALILNARDAREPPNATPATRATRLPPLARRRVPSRDEINPERERGGQDEPRVRSRRRRGARGAEGTKRYADVADRARRTRAPNASSPTSTSFAHSWRRFARSSGVAKSGSARRDRRRTKPPRSTPRVTSRPSASTSSASPWRPRTSCDARWRTRNRAFASSRIDFAKALVEFDSAKAKKRGSGSFVRSVSASTDTRWTRSGGDARRAREQCEVIEEEAAVDAVRRRGGQAVAGRCSNKIINRVGEIERGYARGGGAEPAERVATRGGRRKGRGVGARREAS